MLECDMESTCQICNPVEAVVLLFENFIFFEGFIFESVLGVLRNR